MFNFCINIIMILWKGRGIECFKKDKKCCIVGGLSIVCYYEKKIVI